MAITVIISLQLLTKLLYYTPITILASIILFVLPGLIDIKEAYNIWKVDKMDFLACIGAFLGVIMSFSKVTISILWPKIEMLGRIQGTDVFCSVRHE
ncbi:sulfate transporter 2.1 [Canna indica]|uniref:Sulfate transporter 2.1 n=1 Tax=Canna indica TaxID=4628 RepID=A0AAQ3JY59_9LILI|nr:sulfate transporter 2.1 [Canna indica]